MPPHPFRSFVPSLLNECPLIRKLFRSDNTTPSRRITFVCHAIFSLDSSKRMPQECLNVRSLLCVFAQRVQNTHHWICFWFKGCMFPCRTCKSKRIQKGTCDKHITKTVPFELHLAPNNKYHRPKVLVRTSGLRYRLRCRPNSWPGEFRS